MLQERGEKAQNQHNLHKGLGRFKDKSKCGGDSDCHEEGDNQPTIFQQSSHTQAFPNVSARQTVDGTGDEGGRNFQGDRMESADTPPTLITRTLRLHGA